MNPRRGATNAAVIASVIAAALFLVVLSVSAAALWVSGKAGQNSSGEVQLTAAEKLELAREKKADLIDESVRILEETKKAQKDRATLESKLVVFDTFESAKADGSVESQEALSETLAELQSEGITREAIEEGIEKLNVKIGDAVKIMQRLRSDVEDVQSEISALEAEVGEQ